MGGHEKMHHRFLVRHEYCGFVFRRRPAVPPSRCLHDAGGLLVETVVRDADNGGERDHTLYWLGNLAKPHFDERAFGVRELVPELDRQEETQIFPWRPPTDSDPRASSISRW